MICFQIDFLTHTNTHVQALTHTHTEHHHVFHTQVRYKNQICDCLDLVSGRVGLQVGVGEVQVGGWGLQRGVCVGGGGQKRQ